MEIARVALAVLSCLILLAAGVSTVTGRQAMRDVAAHLRVPWPLYRSVGVLELAGAVGIAVGLWVPWLGVAAGTGVLLLMVGAFLAHARVHDPFAWYVPAIALTATAAGYTVATLLLQG